MNVQIIGITDRGVPNKERLHLRMLAPMDLTYLVVLETINESEQRVLAGGRRAFWFPAKAVNAGDNIILYSGAGYPSEQRNPNGTVNHFYYWWLPQTIWNDPRSTVIVFNVLEYAGAPAAATPLAGLPGRGGMAVSSLFDSPPVKRT